MDFSTFLTDEIDRYTEEAKAKWGKTQAWKEYEEKNNRKTAAQLQSTGNQLMDIFAQIGTLRHLSPDAPEVQACIGRLQDFITQNYYNCTKPILKGLGELYIAGDSMTENIDRAGGPGTAQFAHDAITVYCG